MSQCSACATSEVIVVDQGDDWVELECQQCGSLCFAADNEMEVSK